MKTSKYAPKTPAQSLAQSRAEKSKKDKDNVTRLLGRLSWKAEMLMMSYYKALEIVRVAELQQGAPDSTHPTIVSKQVHQNACSSQADFMKRQAESMFKIDFFEFYTLLERYITTCLTIVGVHVSGTAPRSNVNALRYITNPDLHLTRPLASHAFHANLLEALDDQKCPLHDSFGIQDVRIELGLAKDFRNTWKDADERVIVSKLTSSGDADRRNITLESSQLEHMLRMLIAGSEHAFNVVQTHIEQEAEKKVFSTSDYENQTHSSSTAVASDVPYEYMDDAMDLD